MAGEPGRRVNEFGVEISVPPRAPRPPAKVGDASRAITLLFALVVYGVLAFGLFDGSRAASVGDQIGASDLAAAEWSEMLFLGAVFGVPGTVIAALLAAPRRRGEAPFVGGLVGFVQTLLGYGTLIALRGPFERSAFVGPLLLAIFGLGWIWALPVRRWTVRGDVEAVGSDGVPRR